jgi:hypothetical protein
MVSSSHVRDRRQPDPDPRVLLYKIPYPRLQPLGRKTGATRDKQMVPLRLGSHQSRGSHDRPESALYLACVDAAGIREGRAASVPGKDLNAKKVLELLNVVADCGRCYPELLGGAAKAAMSRGCLECQQRLQRRHSRPLS